MGWACFHDALAKALKPQMSLVTAPEAGVVVIRIALTRLVPPEVSRSLTATLVPCGFVAEAGSGVATGGPAGSPHYLGETGVEMQCVNAATGSVPGECRDTEVGRPYAADTNAGINGAVTTWASGYVNALQVWSYARNAFDKRARLTAQRLVALRGVRSAK